MSHYQGGSTMSIGRTVAWRIAAGIMLSLSPIIALACPQPAQLYGHARDTAGNVVAIQRMEVRYNYTNRPCWVVDPFNRPEKQYVNPDNTTQSQYRVEVHFATGWDSAVDTCHVWVRAYTSDGREGTRTGSTAPECVNPSELRQAPIYVQ
jgi:hypothetical protein